MKKKKVCKHDLISIPHLYDYNKGNSLGGTLFYTEYKCFKCGYTENDLCKD